MELIPDQLDKQLIGDEMNEMELSAEERKVLARLKANYRAGFDRFRVRDLEINLLQVTDLEFLLKGKDPFADVASFPFWSRLWEAAMVLADFLAGQDLAGKRLLELGAGLGAPGLIAAVGGAEVVLSDYESHVLDFERISGAANGFANVQTRMIDWHKPPKLDPFELIVGAEILFREEFFAPLLKVFKQYLAPGGEIYLAHEASRKSLPAFLKLAERDYDIAISQRRFHKDDGELLIVLARLTAKG